MVLKEFPNVMTWGHQYNIGEKPTVIPYPDVNHHVGTPKQKQKNYEVSVLKYNLDGLILVDYRENVSWVVLMYNIYGLRISDHCELVIVKIR